MKLFMNMVRPINRILLLSLTACIFFFVGCNNESTSKGDPFDEVPQLFKEIDFLNKAEPLRPARLQLLYDTIFVSYNNIPRIDRYDTAMNFISSIDLTDPEPIYPTSFYVDDSIIVVADHARKLVVLYDREGKVLTSFGTLPDHSKLLSPFSVFCYGGVAYISDIETHSILAVSLVNVEGLTERGELILTIPSDTSIKIGFPSAVSVTQDGRLLAGDASDGRIKVFTCDGRYIYDFDTIPVSSKPAWHSFAWDNVPDPSLADTNKFDPSGVPYMGRVHVVDGENGAVHMFNPYGKYISSYPADSILLRPSSVVINWKINQILIADPVAGKILIFKY